MPRANERVVNYRRDIPGSINVPEYVKEQLDALSIVHTQQRTELDALRKTRGQRQVTPLRVPGHLQDGIPMSDQGVERLADIRRGSSE